MSGSGLRTSAFHRRDQPKLAEDLSKEVWAALRGDEARFDPAALSPESAAWLYLERALTTPALPTLTADELAAQRPEFELTGGEKLPLTGTQTVRFRQHYGKVPVYGSFVSVELNTTNELLALNSALAGPIGVDAVPQVSPAQVLERVKTLAGQGATDLAARPRLHYYHDATADRWRLVYIVEDIIKWAAEKAPPELPQLTNYILDAHSGELVAEVPRTHSGWRG
jgi:hypothetical protein